MGKYFLHDEEEAGDDDLTWMMINLLFVAQFSPFYLVACNLLIRKLTKKVKNGGEDNK